MPATGYWECTCSGCGRQLRGQPGTIMPPCASCGPVVWRIAWIDPTPVDPVSAYQVRSSNRCEYGHRKNEATRDEKNAVWCHCGRFRWYTCTVCRKRRGPVDSRRAEHDRCSICNRLSAGMRRRLSEQIDNTRAARVAARHHAAKAKERDRREKDASEEARWSKSLPDDSVAVEPVRVTPPVPVQEVEYLPDERTVPHFRDEIDLLAARMLRRYQSYPRSRRYEGFSRSPHG